MAITRKLPNSNAGRDRAMGLAKVKNDNLPVGTVVLNPGTETRLNAQSPAYHSKLQEVTIAHGALKDNTDLKDPAINNTRMWVSHFIQVFNLGVFRGKYPAGSRGYYMLDPGSESVPDLKADSDVIQWALNIDEGDPVRVAAGGAAMVNPTAAEVSAVGAISAPLFVAQNTLTSALDIKEEEVDALNTEADKLIKRVWDEVEAYYSEESPESKRADARLWGVVYVTLGPPAVLTGIVKSAAGEPRAGAIVEVEETGATAFANSEGRYTISTTALGDIKLKATFPGEDPAEVVVNIPDHTTGIDINVPDIVVG